MINENSLHQRVYYLDLDSESILYGLLEDITSTHFIIDGELHKQEYVFTTFLAALNKLTKIIRKRIIDNYTKLLKNDDGCFVKDEN